LRAFHWLDPVFDLAFAKARVNQPNAAILAAASVVFVLVLPVGLLEIFLQGRLMHVPQFLFAVVVLLFCLGPRDLEETVRDYREAADSGNIAAANRVAKELLECEPDADSLADVEEAIYAQANNRIFGVVFWFVLLGPTGAWLFRVLDLMQRRAVEFSQKNDSADNEDNVPWSRMAAAAILLHRIFAWLPGHLLAGGYILGGSFDGAVEAWRNVDKEESALFPGPTDQLLGAVGCGASASEIQTTSERAGAALAQVERTLWFIWLPILALMTLYDLLS
jgi:membrane protein required for beta-lactamase induction